MFDDKRRERTIPREFLWPSFDRKKEFLYHINIYNGRGEKGTNSKERRNEKKEIRRGQRFGRR